MLSEMKKWREELEPLNIIDNWSEGLHVMEVNGKLEVLQVII